MTKKQEERLARLMPAGIPKYIRCYDDAKSGDRYTVVYTGNYNNIGRKKRVYYPPNTRNTQYVGMSGSPFHPQGVCQHGESATQIDRPTYGHLGKKIRFADLPDDCKEVVLRDYKELWKLND